MAALKRNLPRWSASNAVTRETPACCPFPSDLTRYRFNDLDGLKKKPGALHL
jgi:hypothetical protein